MLVRLRAIDAVLPHAEPDTGEFLGSGVERHFRHLPLEQLQRVLRIGQGIEKRFEQAVGNRLAPNSPAPARPT
jgi:hypothetical protein